MRYDPRRTSYEIQAAAHKATKAITTKLASVPKGDVLAVHVGEIHTSPNHIMTEIEIMRNLRNAGVRFAVAREDSTNRMEAFFSKAYGPEVGQFLFQVLERPENERYLEKLHRLHEARAAAYAPMSRIVREELIKE